MYTAIYIIQYLTGMKCFKLLCNRKYFHLKKRYWEGRCVGKTFSVLWLPPHNEEGSSIVALSKNKKFSYFLFLHYTYKIHMK